MAMQSLDSSPIMQLATQGKAEELQEEMKRRALSSLYYFSKVVLNYKDLAKFHLDLCNYVQTTIPDLKRGALCPRGHFKSTILSKTYPLWRLCGGGNDLLPKPLKDPRDLRIAIIGESSTVAAKNLRDIKWNLENNQILKWLFPQVIPPDVGNTKWTETEILLPRGQSFDESTITCMGVGERRTGFHWDMLLYDDIIGEKASQSDAEMKGAIEWFQYAPGMLNDQATGEELMAGTRWKSGTADLYGWIMKEMPIGGADGERSKGFSWYIRSAVEKDENGEEQIIFPERFTHQMLTDIQKRMKSYKYSCQYMNRPSSPEGADFPEDQIKGFEVINDHQGKPCIIHPLDGSSDVHINQLFRVSFLDPSSGGKSAACENAIVVAGMDSMMRVFGLHAWSMNCGYGAAVEKWHHINDMYQCHLNFYEDVGAQKELETIITLRNFQAMCRICNKIHTKLTPQPFKIPGGKMKEDRIRLFIQADFEAGNVYLRNTLGELKRQITNFPHGDLVDQFDAFASARKNLRKPLTDGEAADRRADEEALQAAKTPRIATAHNYGGYV
jgi:hypothetical protein